MSWRRRQSLHEKLAREGGLSLERDPSEGRRPPWDKAGIHGLARPRRWDSVLTVQMPDLPGDELTFVALPDGTLVTDEDAPDVALEPLAEAVEQEVAPPYRAEAVRRTEDVWAVAARAIDVVALPPATPGEEIVVSERAGDLWTIVDGDESTARVPALEKLARERELADYVLEAARIDGDLWEVRISPL